MISLRKFIGVAILAIFTILAEVVNSATTPVPSGAITAYPIPQRPWYAPKPPNYPRPTLSQNPNRP